MRVGSVKAGPTSLLLTADRALTSAKAAALYRTLPSFILIASMAQSPRSVARSEHSKAPPRESASDNEAARPDAGKAAEQTPNGSPTEVIIVGYSAASQERYFPALRRMEVAGSAKVLAVVAPEADLRNLCLQAFPNAAETPSLDAVMARPGALVILASPPRLHPIQASTAFKRGWHVFSETPLAATARDATAMIASSERHERLLAVDLHRRLFPAARYIRSLCRDHLLGPAIRFSLHEGAPLALPPAPITQPKVRMPDGVLADIGVHALDFVTWCFGKPISVSYADDAMGGVEANAFVDLSFPEGVRGTLHFSRDWPTTNSCEFVFERAIVRWSTDEANMLTIQLASAPAAIAGSLVLPTLPDTDPTGDPLPSRPEANEQLMTNVAAAAAGRGKLLIPPSESLHALPLMDECYARRTLIEQPWFTHNEAVHARSLSVPPDIRPS